MGWQAGGRLVGVVFMGMVWAFLIVVDGAVFGAESSSCPDMQKTPQCDRKLSDAYDTDPIHKARATAVANSFAPIGLSSQPTNPWVCNDCRSISMG
jgi:hypothetical protein